MLKAVLKVDENMNIDNSRMEKKKDFINSVRCLVVRSVNYYIPSGLRDIYVVGSFSSGEVTFFHDKYSNEICMSDIDIIVDVNPFTFLKCHIFNLAQKLSEMLTSKLQLKGVKTHVSISITSFMLFNSLRFLKPQNTVYLYELTPIEPTLNNYTKKSNISREFTPNKLDSLNLVFSSIADYVFTKLKLIEDATIHEKTYTIAKRCLTILYSLMLFNGIYPRTYSMRISFARRYFDKLKNVLSDEDIQILDALVDYKLKGDWNILFQKLSAEHKNICEVFNSLDEYFKELATKVLTYELSHYIFTDNVHQMTISTSNLINLLEGYRSKAEVVTHKRLLVTMQYLFLFFREKNMEKLKLALNSILLTRLRVDDLLRYVVGFLFLSVVNGRPKTKLTLQNALETKRMWFLFMA
jgi:predicted nucleotidyltransferase